MLFDPFLQDNLAETNYSINENNKNKTVKRSAAPKAAPPDCSIMMIQEYNGIRRKNSEL